MKISFITTVFKEEETIKKFLESLFIQTKLPDEIIIVDGGSTDNTVLVISNSKFQISNKSIKPKIKLIIKKGNRSVGRNEAIKQSTGDMIVCSDSGNILDKDWIKNITKPFKNPQVDVVSGYYEGLAKTIFQKCVIPYVLVMEDKVNPDNFLPATRSIAFKKSIWKKVGGFPEEYSHNEDYVFAKRLKKQEVNIVFAKDAIVYWLPRKNLKEAFVMIFRFAYGDIEAGVLRPKMLLLFIRYLIAMLLFIAFIMYGRVFIFVLTILFAVYIIWAIGKNYKYVRDPRAYIILPLLQLTADIAIISASFMALFKRIYQ